MTDQYQPPPGGMPLPPHHQPPSAPAQAAPAQAAQYQVDPNTGLVAYGSYDPEVAEAEAEEAEKYAGGSDWYNLKDGPNILRFLPPKPGGKSPFAVRWRHWIDLPNGESVKFNCPQKMAGGFCPICDQAENYKRSADKATREKGYNMSPQRQALAVVINREEPDKGPLVIQLPGKTVYDPLVSMRRDPRGGGDFTDPIQGFDVIIKRSGSGKKKTKYEVLPDRNNSRLADTVPQINEWIMGQPDIADFLGVPTDAEIRQMIAEALGQQPEQQNTAALPAPAVAPRFGQQPQQYQQPPQPPQYQPPHYQQPPQYQPPQYQPPQYQQPQWDGRGPVDTTAQPKAEQRIHSGPPPAAQDDDIPF